MEVVSGDQVVLRKLTFEDSSKIDWVYLHLGKSFQEQGQRSTH